MKNKKQIVVFAGPSGSGKDSILSEIISKFPDKITKLTTATTRKKREGEKEGFSYYFLSEYDFFKNLEEGKIPEHNQHAGNYYGTFLPDLERKLGQGKIVFAQTQLVGAKFLQEKYGAVLIFISPESIDVLKKRILSRAEISENELKKRLAVAKKEINQDSKHYQYQVTNREGFLEKSVEDVLKILEQESVIS
jgi:guanylate kinase